MTESVRFDIINHYHDLLSSSSPLRRFFIASAAFDLSPIRANLNLVGMLT